MKFKVIFSSKNVWDYINFGSGYRFNYYQGSHIDLGSSGTYDSYGYPNLSNVCSGYSAKLWNTYRPTYNSIYGKNNFSLGHFVLPQNIYKYL